LGSVITVLALAAGAAGLMGCRKSAVDVPLRWHGDLDSGVASARAQNKPLFIYFGAEWDAAAKELEQVTFADAEVSALLNSQFVSIHVDLTDDEAPGPQRALQRFKVAGEPTIIILGPGGQSEITRFTSFIPPRILERALKAATREDGR